MKHQQCGSTLSEACEASSQWEDALVLLGELAEMMVQPTCGCPDWWVEGQDAQTGDLQGIFLASSKEDLNSWNWINVDACVSKVDYLQCKHQRLWQSLKMGGGDAFACWDWTPTGRDARILSSDAFRVAQKLLFSTIDYSNYVDSHTKLVQNDCCIMVHQ